MEDISCFTNSLNSLAIRYVGLLTEFELLIEIISSIYLLLSIGYRL